MYITEAPRSAPIETERGQMIDDPDIFRAAKLLIDQHGNDAASRAAQPADGLLAEGDPEGSEVWHRILEAIEELTRGRREGERLN